MPLLVVTSRRQTEASVESVIGKQWLGECSAKFGMPGCHTGGPVRWSVVAVAGDGRNFTFYLGSDQLKMGCISPHPGT